MRLAGWVYPVGSTHLGLSQVNRSWNLVLLCLKGLYPLVTVLHTTFFMCYRSLFQHSTICLYRFIEQKDKHSGWSGKANHLFLSSLLLLRRTHIYITQQWIKLSRDRSMTRDKARSYFNAQNLIIFMSLFFSTPVKKHIYILQEAMASFACPAG